MKIQQSVFTTLFLIRDLSDLDLLAAAGASFLPKANFNRRDDWPLSEARGHFLSLCFQKRT